MVRIGGIILCGGQSKRMGRPKASLPFADETLLQRVVRLLKEAVSPLVVVAARDQQLPTLPGDVEVVRDEEEGRGPLQGLAAGLTALVGRVDAAYVSACDVPILQPAFVRRMIDLLGVHQISVPKIDGFHHPLAAVYRLDVLDIVKNLLHKNRRAVQALFDEADTRVVSAAELADVDPTFASLRNLNTLEDYEKALRDGI
ncbi:MAG: molybdenum cofactor guanylyltransferase [Planctomycetes bacterium]|nr:molybdenum cofactor guanylyltransferase [Planctomycetota bacterium]